MKKFWKVTTSYNDMADYYYWCEREEDPCGDNPIPNLGNLLDDLYDEYSYLLTDEDIVDNYDIDRDTLEDLRYQAFINDCTISSEEIIDDEDKEDVKFYGSEIKV